MRHFLRAQSLFPRRCPMVGRTERKQKPSGTSYARVKQTSHTHVKGARPIIAASKNEKICLFKLDFSAPPPGFFQGGLTAPLVSWRDLSKFTTSRGSNGTAGAACRHRPCRGTRRRHGRSDPGLARSRCPPRTPACRRARAGPCRPFTGTIPAASNHRRRCTKPLELFDGPWSDRRRRVQRATSFVALRRIAFNGRALVQRTSDRDAVDSVHLCAVRSTKTSQP